MSRMNAHLKRNFPDENDVAVKTPYKQDRRHETPLKLINTPHSSISKSLPKTPGLSIKPLPNTPGLNFRSNNVLPNTFTTPIQKPSFEVFQDENDENLSDSKSEQKSLEPQPSNLSLVDEEDEIDTCKGNPVYNFYESDFDWLKDIEDVELHDPSVEYYKKIYGDCDEEIDPNFVIYLPDSEPEDEEDIADQPSLFDLIEML
jgi:hypothetical protein